MKKKIEIPKGATMLEIMQIGQLQQPKMFEDKQQLQKPKKVEPKSFEEDLKESIAEDTARRSGSTSGNDFLKTQLDYDGHNKDF